VDRRNYNRYGTPDMPANKRILAEEQQRLRTDPITLDQAQREVIELAIREVCEHRRYALHAVNARSIHVHSVVSASSKPEHVMDSFKAYATRKLRELSLLAQNVKPWSRHGSTPYLWTEEDVAQAVDYVVNGQGDEPFRLKG
jgi:REP element-mobilizing transposase RayT